MLKRQKEVSIRFNKNYNFLQILLINIVKFICGCGFDYFTIYPVLKHTSETLRMHLNLLNAIYCNRDGHVVRFYLQFLKAGTSFFFIKAADSQYIVRV